jgi:hypothetical protein
VPNNPDSGTIFIQRGDVKHPGTYTVNHGMITVRGPNGSRTTHLTAGSGTTPPSVKAIESIARLSLAKVLDQDNRK